jgi:amino acid adenylation domain-containing protein/FkbM family methyltransferase
MQMRRDVTTPGPFGSSEIDQQLDLWKQFLDNAPLPLKLPTDHSNHSMESSGWLSESTLVSDVLAQSLLSLSANYDVSLPATLLSAFLPLLWRYTEQNELLITCAVGHRRDLASLTPSIERTSQEPVDLRCSTQQYSPHAFPFGTNIDGQASFASLLTRTHQELIATHSQACIPLDRLNLPLDREPLKFTGSPISQVMMLFENEDIVAPCPIETSSLAPSSEIVLRLRTEQDHLQICLGYNSRLFESSTIARMLSHYETILSSVVADASLPLSRLNILPPGERVLITSTWNQTTTDFPHDVCLHELFEQHAERRPEGLALFCGDISLSYGELDARSNQLAHHLQNLGVGPNSLVAICVDRSPEMVVGLLGILKAGGAYLPLDPEYPHDRLLFMLQDAGSSVLLTQQHLLSSLPNVDEESTAVVCLDRDWELIADYSREKPNSNVGPDDLVYVIYTSGSTGRPKGVMVDHRGRVNNFSDFNRRFNINSSDRMLVITSLSFDMCAYDVLGTLAGGATVVLPLPQLLHDPAHWADLIKRHRVTTWHSVPAMMEMLLEFGSGKPEFDINSLRFVLLGGDWIAVSLPDRVRAQAQDSQVVSLGGATELSMDSTVYLIEECNPEWKSIPYGKPLANQEAYVLDAELQPQPIGIPGELHLGGAGVAWGYLNRPELTGEKFIPHPFSQEPGARLYKTGDLARYKPDGNLELLGRMDFQVKIRGFRVELGEIAATLREHPDIHDVVVIAKQIEHGDKRIVAYVVPNHDTAGVVCQFIRPENEDLLKDLERYELPNGLTIVHINKAQTKFLYQEIFEEKSYFKHDIALPPDACIFDVGANIGLFSLFVAQKFPRAKIYAFEPIPTTFQALKANAAIYELDATLFECGVADRETSATFTFYPHFTIGSSRSTNLRTTEEIVREYLRSVQGVEVTDLDESLIDELLTECLTEEAVTCQLQPLSKVIRDYDVEKIDLLKIDAEGSEFEVLEGLEDDHWPRIMQLVMEVHGQDQLDLIVPLLEKYSYQVEVEEGVALQETILYNLYARRLEQGKDRTEVSLLSDETVNRWTSPAQFIKHIHEFSEAKLPETMVPSAFVLLDQLPLTPNGKVDRRALSALDFTSSERLDAFVAPRTELEADLAVLWSELLGVERVGIDDNFFNLGGHSLLATKLISRVRAKWQVELPMRTIFKFPTVARLAAEIEKAKLSGETLKTPPLVHVPNDGFAPPSHAQQRLWFVEQLAPGTAAYNIPSVIPLHGALNPALLEQSLNEIVRRHEILRTSFATQDFEPVQVIASELRLPLIVIDLTGHDVEERRREAERLQHEEAARPFRLDQPPLIRALLIRLNHQEHVLMLTMHHIISDGWSMGVFLRELSLLYAAFEAGEPSPLPDLTVQYADYARWQREWLRAHVLDAQIAYWRQQLADVPVLELPIKNERPLVLGYRGETLYHVLPLELYERLQKLSQNEGVTLYMTLLAAFQTLLARYSGQKDIVVGSPVANRTYAELEDLIGFFVNMLVMRSRLSSNLTFSELLRQVRETALGAYAHQDVPFERLVEELHAERDLSRHPLFQVAFALQNAPDAPLELPDLTVQVHQVEEQGAKFDLSLLIEEQSDGLHASLTYDTDLFDRNMAERMLRSWHKVLDEVVKDSQQRIWDLEVSTEEEKRRVLVEWNNTATPFPMDASVQQLFEEQVKRTPRARAVKYENEELSYQELNRRANQLAHRLRRMGVQVETKVCLLMERGIDIVVAMLAVAKAGGTYVPLDLTYPTERLLQMMGDAKPRVILTTKQARGLIDRPDVLEDVQVLMLDEEHAALSRESDQNPANLNNSDDLLYVIYTSGSTGKPKGVSVSHKAVTRLIKGSDYVQIDATDRVAQASNSSFDAITFELWGALLNGAQLVVISKDVALSPLAFATTLKRERITTLFLTTALFNQIAAEAPSGFSELRHLLFGGEAVDVNSVREILKHGKPQRLLHVYGPTENTTFSTWFLIEDVASNAHTILIGQPIANTASYVLDEQMNPVAIGVVGELYLGGAGLARGYLNQPEMTAEKFVPHPFSETGGERLYRTGDLVRYQADGALEFLGRADNQVKVRGFRIELNEIETVLLQQAGVREAVVVVHEESATDKRLVAYVVSETGAALSSGGLRAAVREQLPEYMVPATFVQLPELPLTPNKKVDRRALPAPDWSSLGGSEEVLHARTPSEQLLVDIWAEVLGIDALQLSVRDNFFELGGHSLLATQVVSRIRKLFKQELPVRQLFQQPTIEAVAEWLRREAGVKGTAAPPMQAVVRSAGMPLSFAQKRLWFLDQLQPNNSFYNITGALRLRGELQVAALAATLNTIVRRHESLRTTFVSVNGQPVQVSADELTVNLNAIDLQSFSEQERELAAQRLIEAESEMPFDLATGPLFRAQLLRLSDDEHVLLMSMHHIVADGWSIGVLLSELAVLYNAFSSGKESPLPELAIQYADFATWQRSWLKGARLEGELEYWKQRLHDAPSLLELPTDRPRPAIQSFRGTTIRFEFPLDLSQALDDLSRREGMTLYMILMAAFQTLLARYSGQSTILVGCPIANRNHAELEPLIGFFVNILTLRTDFTGNPNFHELASQVRDTALGAYAHQDVPFEMLIEQLQPERNLSHSPLYQVVFSMQNAPMPNLELNGLDAQWVVVDTKTAKFDLVLNTSSRDEGLVGSMEYDTVLFDQTTIERMLKHFQTLLTNIVADPEKPVLEQTLLTDEERNEFLFAWNETAEISSRASSIQELFEAQVERTPDAIALSCGNRELTYQELNRRANQLAHHLRRLNVGPGVLVGLYLAHSPETIIAILATLKAGAAYVPLEPEHPRARTAFIFEDAAIPIVLTQQQLLEKLPESGPKTICLDVEEFAHESGENAEPYGTAEELAYVMYTSGSTGQPKGVKVQRRALLNYVEWASRVYLEDEQLNFALYSSLAFDLTVTSIYVPLITGNQIIIFPKQGRDLPLLDAFDDSRVGVIKLTPSHLALIRERDNRRSNVRRLIVGGEALTTGLSQVSESFGHRVYLYNEYGPTEATVGCMIYRFDPERDERAMVPIGTPANGAQIYVLDQNGNPVAENVLGELYISGTGLAQGYLNRDELTRERFIENPFIPGRRMYKTGDLARRLVDGNLEYIGRQDDQIKFHGYRIELNEIKSVLNRHPQVRDSVVVLRKNKTNHDVLVAYYVARHEISTAELRQWLAGYLIEETIPGIFVHLKKLPLTLNGKVNFEALPNPEELQGEFTRVTTTPRSPVEEALIEIWAEVLEVPEIGIHDNFFELGGHSLLATLVVSRICEVFQIDLPLRSLFQSPTIAGLGQKIEGMLDAGLNVETLPIVPVPREGPLRLSFAQQRLWFLSQLEPDSPFYNVPIAIEISGPLNVPVLTKTFSEIVLRHEALRTTFVNVDGQPVQVISQSPNTKLVVVDLKHLSAEQRRDEVNELAFNEARTPFDLAQDPLLRTKLLELSSTEHVLLLTIHHIVADGWSMGVLLREMAALYDAFSRDEASPLPELTIQYADFAHWQREWLRGDVLDVQFAYWKRQLAGVSGVLDLPTDYPRPAFQSYRGAITTFNLPQPLARQLKELSTQSDVTLYMTLLAAFNVLLFRYTGQTDILVGSPIANRNRAETEALIGFFINALLMRTDLSGNPTFEEFLSKVREVALEAYANKDVPFEKLVEELQPERSLNRHPLFQVVFALQSAPGQVDLPGLELKTLPVDNRTSMFDLSLLMEESSSGLSGVVQYNTDLFKAETISRMMGHFQKLLEAIATNPKQKISEVQFLGTDEQRRLLLKWNTTTSDFGSELTIAQLFETQVELFPTKAALLHGDEQISYSELNKRANQLAHFLRQQSVKAETVVALCVERSPEMVIALLAILKAGGAYLPLDPNYPKERLSIMIEDAQPALLLTDSGLLEHIPTDHSMRVYLLGEALPQLVTQPVSNPATETCAGNLAYLMYTSGSSGQPKGIAVNQRSVIRLVRETNYANFSPEQVFLQFAPLSFDASTLELWGPMLNGGQLAIMDKHGSSTSELADAIVGYGVTTLWLTASLFNLIVDEQLEALRGLKQLLAGGDVLSVEHVKRFLREVPGCVLINGYGPTENTTFSCCHPMTAWDDERSTVPIGRPIANTASYVLDEQMNAVAIGVVGELYLGGAGLARGYLNQPELTAEKFVPHPFSETGGERLYRTGDLVRYQADGALEFLGRADNQVKVRGFRIELNEIETVLLQQTGVREAVVVVHEESATDKRLVAYVVSETGAAISSGGLRAAVREQLPEYMVPATFVQLPELPLTPNKKVDRRALPAPDWSSLGGSEEVLRALTPSEQLLVDIWAEVLGIDAGQLSVRDNFFELGGHSLLATQVVSRIRKLFKQELPVRQLFQQPTIEAVAEWLRREAGVKGTAAPPMQAVVRSAGLPLSFAQQRLWFLNQLEPNNSFYNIPVALRLRGELQVEALAATLNTIVRRHESLRTTFVAVDGQPLQIIANAQDVELPLVEVQGATNEEREADCLRLIKEEARQLFDLATGPLFRAKLLRLSDDEHVLLIIMHHIISDGWSIGILTREMSRIYSAIVNDSPTPLTDLAIQYPDFAHWQRKWLQGEVLETQLAHWKNQLQGAPDVLQLPTDYPRPLVQTYRGAHIDFQLSPQLLEQLSELSRRLGSTLYMTLLAAFNVLLFRYSGQTDILVGSPVANRNHAETENLVGFFVNTLVLRTKLDPEESFDKLLGRVRDVALDAYANQDLPFEKLVEELQPDRNLNRHPLFQVAFATQNVPRPELEFSGLQTSFFDFDSGTANFDLWVESFETETGTSFSFEYNTDLFEEATIKRMCGRWQRLLEAVVTDPKQPISQLPLLTDAEREQLLVQWCQTQTPYPADACIHHLFEGQAKLQPDAPAVVFEETQLSYRDLDAHANQLARHLLKLGVGPEKPVALCVDRSVEMVVGLLGILKAGAAYVPLDPTYPKDRLAYFLENSRATVLLTKQQYIEDGSVLADHDSELQTVCLDLDWHVIAEHAKDSPESGVISENLAYVIYTSGSTGKPKGVSVTHRNLVHSTQARFSYYQKPVKSFLLLSSFAFDSSVAGIFWTLCAGGRLVLPEARRQQDPNYLADLIDRCEVSHFLCLPSLYQLLLEHVDTTTLHKLDAVIVAGEPCPTQLPATHGEKLPGVSLFNEYGPTEGTVWSSVYDCRLETQRQLVPIGHAISNTQLYVLDAKLNPVPVGITGELYLGGEGVARGYLGKPQLTAERFIPHPFSEEGGARLYRTGDLVRYLPSGDLEFLGRVDHQVKVRGYRVELEEIEAALREHPGVSEAVAIVRDWSAIQPARLAHAAGNGGNGEETASAPLLLERIGSLDYERVMRLLEEVEALTPQEPELDRRELAVAKNGLQRIRRDDRFEVSLRLFSDQFIAPPREVQRDWIVSKALQEITADLMHMDAVSRRFVKGQASHGNGTGGNGAAGNGTAAPQIGLGVRLIMEDWQIPIMAAMAKVATESKGDVLEVGFGRGISAGFIQQHEPRSHTVVECDARVIEDFYEWKKQYPGRDIRLIEGKWQDVTDQFGLYDGIFFHTSTLTEEDFVEHVVKSVTYAEHFFPAAAEHLRKGGVFTYLTLEIDSFSRAHQRRILNYFDSLTLSVQKLTLPDDCQDMWWADSMVIVKAVK